jgi:hypothetical protein
MLAVDGSGPQALRKIVELELDNQCEREERLPQVFESARILANRGNYWGSLGPDPGNAATGQRNTG